MKREELIQQAVENLIKLRHRGITNKYMLNKVGLSRGHTELLHVVFHHPDSPVNEVAKALGISTSAATQLIDPLVDDGFLSRTNDKKDRRIVRISMTEEGVKRLKKLKKYFIEDLRNSLEVLDDKDLAELNRIHQKIINSLPVQIEKEL